MTNLTAEIGNKTAQPDGALNISDGTTAQVSSLDGCYRQIGISAVAAAVRYQGAAKNPAYAPSPIKWQDHIGDTAA